MIDLFRRNWLALACISSGLIVLCALGTWQVKRLFWKEELLARIEKRIANPPIPLTEAMGLGFDKTQQNYLPVKTIGEYDHSTEAFFFTTGPNGLPGWNVHTALAMPDNKIVIVNRGFVPFDFKSPDKRSSGQLNGIQSVEGLLRFPLTEKPFGSLENNLEKREFYWRSIADFVEVMQIQNKEVLPVIIDLGQTEVPGGLPIGATSILSFPNNHLQYAVTWFGLALTLLGVGGYFVYTRERTHP